MRLGTPVDGVHVLASLSPSRAADFRTCPLMFRFRTIDRLARGAVAGRTARHRRAQGARGPLRPARARAHARSGRRRWSRTPGSSCSTPSRRRPRCSAATAPDIVEWLASCRESLRAYFDLEDPRRLEPAEREVYVEALLDSRLLLRGFVDRIDVAPDGAIRVVDYKTGSSPGVGFEAQALFQMRFYALVIWRTRGVVPKLLQLIYLGDGQVISYEPDEHDLRATERLVEAVWRAIEARPCDRRLAAQPGLRLPVVQLPGHCPAFGNEPPPLPAVEPERDLPVVEISGATPVPPDLPA